MFFSAFIGNDRGFCLWREALNQHACWVGLTSHLQTFSLTDSRKLAFGWLDSKPPEKNARWKQTEDFLVATSFGEATLESQTVRDSNGSSVVNNKNCNAIKVEASLITGEISFVIPPTTPEQFYFTRTPDGYFFSDDLRLLRHFVSTQLDERAICALFQYGSIPPPLTPYKNVQRIPGGHVFTLKGSSHYPVCTPFFFLKNAEREQCAESNPETKIQETLDRILTDTPKSALLYFSGGVDSGLLASRLAQLGRTDVQLVNYAFDHNDEESQLAQRMASHFGMTCHRIEHDPDKVGDVLQRIGEDYSFPYGDCSTVPTNIMVHESLRWAMGSSAAIEGTGADGAFGVGARYREWARVYALPTFLRQQAKAAYLSLELWKHDSKRERVGRVARKSIDMPLGPAVVAENALAGIAYDIPDEIRLSLHEAIRLNFEVMSVNAGSYEQLSFLDLVWVCAGRMAPKSFEPLRKHGIQPIYPFLQTPMVLSSSAVRWADKCPAGETKGILKELLGRTVPREWVYRRKSGFAPPHRELLGSKVMQEFLQEVVLSPENPLLDFCRVPKVRQIIERAGEYKTLSPGAYDFLWTLTFASGWLAQLPECKTQPGRVLRDSWAVASDAKRDTSEVGIAN